MNSFLILSVVILIFSIVIHEVAHGWMANRLGDPTAKLQGRLTLNPIPHIDVVGSILLPGLLVLTGSPVLFGWAKPVPYNPYNLQGRYAELKVAIVGPISNILIALVFGLLFRLGVLPQLTELFVYGVIINGALAIFNMVPIPPLDGSKVLFELLPARFQEFREVLERYGFVLIIVFLFVGLSLISPLIYRLSELILGASF